MAQFDYDAAFSRLMDAMSCSSQRELSAKLGISQSSVSGACIRKKGLPSSWLLQALRYSNTNPDWVLNGYPNSRFLVPAEAPTRPAGHALGELITAMNNIED